RTTCFSTAWNGANSLPPASPRRIPTAPAARIPPPLPRTWREVFLWPTLSRMPSSSFTTPYGPIRDWVVGPDPSTITRRCHEVPGAAHSCHQERGDSAALRTGGRGGRGEAGRRSARGLDLGAHPGQRRFRIRCRVSGASGAASGGDRGFGRPAGVDRD